MTRPQCDTLHVCLLGLGQPEELLCERSQEEDGEKGNENEQDLSPSSISQNQPTLNTKVF